MAAKPMSAEKPTQIPPKIESFSSQPSLSSYLGLSFAVFLGLLPRSAVSYISSLQSRNRILSLKLFQAEDQLKTLRSRRKEDSKANARVVEIFASHRQAWQREEKRLLARIEEAGAEIERTRGRVRELQGEVERLEGEVKERDEMLDFVARHGDRDEEEEEEDEKGFGDFDGVRASDFDGNGEAEAAIGSGREFSDSDSLTAMMMMMGDSDSKRWLMERSINGWQQDMQYDSLESKYHMKNFVARRESPWKVDGDSNVSSRLKLLEQELVNLENVGKGDLSKVSSLMRKQAKRYQSFTGKIDDLCRRMQANDPYEPTLSPDLRSQQQTEFLLEAVRLQHRAAEIGQKLTLVHAETTKSYAGDELAGQSKLSTRRSLETIGNKFKEIQRNLEIWLARIIGDVEGMLARDGASCVRDYYISRYPFVR